MTDITDQLVVLKENGVGLVKLNNQGKRNAMTFEMWRDIPEILDDFEAPSDLGPQPLVFFFPCRVLPILLHPLLLNAP